jgi:hypothetical protein
VTTAQADGYTRTSRRKNTPKVIMAIIWRPPMPGSALCRRARFGRERPECRPG